MLLLKLSLLQQHPYHTFLDTIYYNLNCSILYQLMCWFLENSLNCVLHRNKSDIDIHYDCNVNEINLLIKLVVVFFGPAEFIVSFRTFFSGYKTIKMSNKNIISDEFWSPEKYILLKKFIFIVKKKTCQYFSKLSLQVFCGYKPII